MKRLTLMLVLVVLLVAGGAWAMKGSADVVTTMPGTPMVSAAPGTRVDFAIKVDIAKKWHIYAHGDSNFIGVDLVPVEGFPLQDLQAEYPHGHAGEFFGEQVVMISGQNLIKASALVPEGLAAGVHDLKFTVTAQACDDKSCLPPADIPVTVKLTVK